MLSYIKNFVSKFLFFIIVFAISIFAGFWFKSFEIFVIVFLLFSVCRFFVFLDDIAEESLQKAEEERQKEEDYIKTIKEAYENALKNKNKSLALKLGREYYSSLRADGRLTIYDEQAIQNDLLSMDN